MRMPLPLFRQHLHDTIAAKKRQGHVVDGLVEKLNALPAGYDAFVAFADRLADLPLRPDWPYREPNGLEEIWAECAPDRPGGPVGRLDPKDAARRAEAAFYGTVAGCILGKPLEVDPTLDEIRRAAEAVGEWPIHDYISERMLEALGRRHGSWTETTRGRIADVAPDDDLNYRLLGLLVVERHGPDFTKDHLRDLWLANLPVGMTFGPERTMLLRAGIQSFWNMPFEYGREAGWLNPKDEFCGALIRVDTYGYACAGRPALAAELAWRDASWTHRRTGIYGAMFVAAAIAAAFTAQDPLALFETALGFVPRRSRFHEIVADSIQEVRRAGDWLDGYARIHNKYAEYTHCRVYQEVGTLINTVRFARDVGHGISMQVAQGNDTDCFGATAGSILGAWFGPGHLEPRWLEPFNDRLRCALAQFHEQRLSAVAERMARLPALAVRPLAEAKPGPDSPGPLAADDGLAPPKT